MKLQTLILGLFLILGLSGSSAIGQSDRPTQDVTFCQLAKDPSGYVGRQIRVLGILRFAMEIVLLEQPECCPGKILDDVDVVIKGNPVSPDSNSRKLVRKLFSGSSGVALVVLVGTLNGRVLKVDKVERIEQLSRPPR